MIINPTPTLNLLYYTYSALYLFCTYYYYPHGYTLS